MALLSAGNHQQQIRAAIVLRLLRPLLLLEQDITMDSNTENSCSNMFSLFNSHKYGSESKSSMEKGFRNRNPTLLNIGGLGISTFFAANHPVESCGSNGLPLTPNSVQILGKFCRLSQLHHANLCAYIQVCRIHHGNMLLFAFSVTL